MESLDGKNGTAGITHPLTPSLILERGDCDVSLLTDTRIYMKGSENSVIIETARALRRKNTRCESILWQKLRNKQLNGAKFHRQHAIKFIIDGRKRFFVADFYCSEHKLVIEIDGKIHERQKDYDESRTYIMNTMGIKVIRFKNEEVENNFENVVSEITKELS